MEQKNPQRVSERVREAAEKYNWKGIRFPVEISQYRKFEKQNPGIAVSAYELVLDMKQVDCEWRYKYELRPLYVSNIIECEKHLMLMLLTEGEKRHYILMKDLSPFIMTKNRGKHYPCRFCLHGFTRKDLLDEHQPNCMTHSPALVELPHEPVKFKKYEDTIAHPVVIYADFESTLVKVDSESTTDLQKHVPNSWCVYIKCGDDQYSRLELYHGSDVAAKFVKCLHHHVKWIAKMLKVNVAMKLTDEEKKAYKEATVCYVCGKGYSTHDWKVRDH